MARDLTHELRVLAALAIFALACLARIPSEHCSCDDPPTTEKRVCMYGELRHALRTLTIVAPVTLPPYSPTTTLAALSRVGEPSRPYSIHVTPLRARSPPRA